MAAFAKLNRPLNAPFGIPVSVPFYGHDPVTKDYKDASKIKTLDVHPVHPWVVTGDEAGNVVIWDYQSEAMVVNVSVESFKGTQKSALETFEAHAAFAASQSTEIPDAAGPGLGVGLGTDPGALIGGATESHISAVVSDYKRRSLLTDLPEDIKSGRTGHIRGVRFADEHVLAQYCGCGRADEDGTDGNDRVRYTSPGVVPPLCPSADAMAAGLSYCLATDGAAGANKSVPHAPDNWLLVLCESRVLVLDYTTAAVIDIPHVALLLEATGPSALSRTTGKGRPGVHSASIIGPGTIAFGCEDGVIRVWSSDMNAVTQTVRSPVASGRPLSHLHTVCALGTAPRVLLVSACVDGTINVWEILAGRQIVDNGRGGWQQCKLGSDLAALTLCPVSMLAVALTSDRAVSVWDISKASTLPQVATSRLVTSSAAAEGGVGSRMMAAVALSGHPFFPPRCVLSAAKGPHLELAVVGTSDTGSIVFDLRTARNLLPSKLKVYALQGHPFKPDLVVCGTNIGVFVVSIASNYTAAALCATHPTWHTPAHKDPDAESADIQFREGLVTVHLTASGALVATECLASSAASPEEGPSAIAAIADRRTTTSGDDDLERVVSSAASFAVRQHRLMQPLSPLNAGPPTGGVKAASLQPNVLIPLSSQLKAPGSLPGSRGVKLRVSGSGRYLAAVWPDLKCYAIYRLGFANLLAMSSDGGEDRDWTCEYMDGGSGIDLAWSGATTTAFDDTAGKNTAADSGGRGPPRLDRFVVLEPGAVIAAGRGPVGGGMAIGTVVDTKARKKWGGKPPPAFVTQPSKLSLRQIPVSMPLSEIVKPVVILPDLPLPQEALAVWGGPALAIAIASDTGVAAANLTAALQSASLQFYSWDVFYPPQPAETAPAPQMSESASSRVYSGAAPAQKDKSLLPRLLPVGTTTATPSPSVLGVANNTGVTWNADCTRLAVAGPSMLYVMAVIPAKSATTIVAELCRVPVVAAALTWCSSSLVVVTADGRVCLVVPPCIDLSASDGQAPCVIESGRRLTPAVVELSCMAPPPAFSAAIQGQHFPLVRKGVANVFGCAPVGVIRGQLVTLHWFGGRDLDAGANAGVGLFPLSITHPGIRAALAVSGSASGTHGLQIHNYLQATVAAAQWGARMPDSAQASLAVALTDLGGVAAALMLPLLSPSIGVPIALSTRGNLVLPTTRPKSRVDVIVAINYLRKVVMEASDELLYEFADGAWEQIAAFLALSTVIANSEWPAIRQELVAFMSRLGDHKLVTPMLRVAATLHNTADVPSVASDTVAAFGELPTAGNQHHPEPVYELVKRALVAARS